MRLCHEKENVTDLPAGQLSFVETISGHENGAVYGAPDKKYDGRTHLDNLYVCGTDQGMVGIIGSIVSGITIANKYLLGG